MPVIAPDTGSPLNAAGLLANPSGLTLADYTSTPSTQLAQAQATGQLSQLSDQLALEKAERQADMATTQYKIAATGYLQNNLSTMSEADRQSMLASIATSKAVGAQQTGALAGATAANQLGTPEIQARAQYLASQAGLNWATLAPDAQQYYLTAAQAQGQYGGQFRGATMQTFTGSAGAGNSSAPGSLANATVGSPPADSPFSVPTIEAYPGSAAKNVPAAPATNSFAFPTTLLGSSTGTSSLLAPDGGTPAAAAAVPVGPDGTPQTVAPAAVAPSAQATLGTLDNPQQLFFDMPGASPQQQALGRAYQLQNFAKDGADIEIQDPTTLQTRKYSNVKYWPNGAVASAFPVGVVKSDQMKASRNLLQDYVNLGVAQRNIASTVNSLDAYKTAFPGTGWDSMKQAYAAEVLENKDKPQNWITGLTSVVQKNLALHLEAPQTKDLVANIRNLQSTMQLLDDKSKDGLGQMAPKVSDIQDVASVENALKGSENYINDRIKTYESTGIASRIRAADASSNGPITPQNVPTQSPTTPPNPYATPGTASTAPAAGTKGFFNGQPVWMGPDGKWTYTAPASP
jgi:hypothetical protein